MLCYHKISVFCSFNSGGGGRAGAKYITTNANTNENTGASVNVNSRAPEAPGDGNGDARSYGYGGWGYKPYYHRSGDIEWLSSEPTAPEAWAEIQGKRTGGKGKVL